MYIACLKDAPKNVIEYLYNQYPKAASMQDKNTSWTPLQCSIENKFDEEVMLYLLKAEPSAVFMPNDFGNTPLHNAIKRRLSYDIIKALVDSAITNTNSNKIGEISSFLNFRGETPLDTFLKVWYFSIKNFILTN